MGKQEYFFAGVMGLVALAINAWLLVGVWPLEWITWRAEHGDQQAIEYMYKQTVIAGDGEGAVKWSGLMRKMSQQEMLFMFPQSRKVMMLLRESMGEDTSLLRTVN